MALSLVQHIWDNLNALTSIDVDFSSMIFSFIDEENKEARIDLLKRYFGLTEGSPRTS